MIYLLHINLINKTHIPLLYDIFIKKKIFCALLLRALPWECILKLILLFGTPKAFTLLLVCFKIQEGREERRTSTVSCSSALGKNSYRKRFWKCNLLLEILHADTPSRKIFVLPQGFADPVWEITNLEHMTLSPAYT